MNLDPREVVKADPALRAALRDAEKEHRMRAILVLDDGSEYGEQDEASHEDRPPKAFVSRADYRRDLLDRRRDQLAARLDPTLDYLRKLSLRVRGGSIGRTVVIEGEAGQIVASLDLPRVQSATLDTEIDLVRTDRNLSK